VPPLRVPREDSLAHGLADERYPHGEEQPDEDRHRLIEDEHHDGGDDAPEGDGHGDGDNFGHEGQVAHGFAEVGVRRAG